MAGKAEIRARMRAPRRALSAEERRAASLGVCARLSAMDLARPIAVYLATADEIDLSAFIVKALADGKVLAAPRWNGSGYELARLEGLDGKFLRRGPMGVLEPRSDEIFPPATIGAWIVPGLAFTADGRRIGYGGGWYDRMLEGVCAPKIGVAYPFQILEDLPSLEHDVRLDTVVF